MNNHSKEESVNSRRSFIAGFGGVLATAAALRRTMFGGDPKRESLQVPASPPPRYTEHRIPRDGVSLHVEDHGSGKPVVLLHGWPDSSYLWRNQIPFLVANGFRAVAPDQRGFGRSDRPEGVAAYSLQNAVADLVGILDALGIDKADIVAHDWGSAVAWLTAATHPNRVRRLVVLSVPHPLAPFTLRQRGWPGTCCFSSSKELRRRGCSATTGLCSGKCSEAMVISNVTSRICPDQML